MRRQNIQISGFVILLLIGVAFAGRWDGRKACRQSMKEHRLQVEQTMVRLDSINAQQQDTIAFYQDSLQNLITLIERTEDKLVRAERSYRNIQRITNPSALEKSLRNTILSTKQLEK